MVTGERRRARPGSVWELLKDEERRRELNQNEMARLIGVSSSVYSKWVRNERVPDPASCDRIADALHFDRDYVLALAGHRPDLDLAEERPDEVAIRAIIPRLDARGLEAVRLAAERELDLQEKWPISPR